MLNHACCSDLPASCIGRIASVAAARQAQSPTGTLAGACKPGLQGACRNVFLAAGTQPTLDSEVPHERATPGTYLRRSARLHSGLHVRPWRRPACSACFFIYRAPPGRRSVYTHYHASPNTRLRFRLPLTDDYSHAIHVNTFNRIDYYHRTRKCLPPRKYQCSRFGYTVFVPPQSSDVAHRGRIPLKAANGCQHATNRTLLFHNTLTLALDDTTQDAFPT